MVVARTEFRNENDVLLAAVARDETFPVARDEQTYSVHVVRLSDPDDLTDGRSTLTTCRTR